MLGSSWKENTSGEMMLPLEFTVTFGTIGLDCAGTVGTGIVPSWPPRKTLNAGLTLAGLHRVPPAPVLLQAGPSKLKGCAKPSSTAGMITLFTVFFPSLIITYHARISVSAESMRMTFYPLLIIRVRSKD